MQRARPPFHPQNSLKSHALLLLATAATLSAQYVSPLPPPPAPGILDDALPTLSPDLAGWDVGLNERLRYEDRDGAGTTHAGPSYDFFAAAPTANSNEYGISRLMPRLGYAAGWWSFQIEARSSYSWGDDRYSAAAAGEGLADDDGPAQFELAYFSLGNLKRFPVSLTVGRQELAYGDQRLVGSALWLNVPHTFNAVKLRYQSDSVGADLFVANPVYAFDRGFDRAYTGDMLSGAYFDFPRLSAGQVTEAYLFARNVSRSVVGEDWSEVPSPFRFPAPEDIYTLGFRTKTKPGPQVSWDYGLEAMAQFGDRTAVFPSTTAAAAKTAPRLDQRAWAAVAQAGHTWTGAVWSPRLALIASAASGDRNPNDRDSGTFQNLLPSNHGLYGIMDLSGLQNLEDIRIAASAKPSATARLALEVHQQYLMSTNDYWYNAAGVPRNTPGAAPGSGRGFGVNPGYGRDLGQEADAMGGWAPWKGFLLEAGVGRYFAGPYIEESLRNVGAKTASYGYVQATVNL